MDYAETRISGMIKHQTLWELLLLLLPVVWQVQLRTNHICFSESITFSHFTSLKENNWYREKWQNRDSDRVLSLAKSQGSSAILRNHFCCFFCVVILTPALFYSGHLKVPKLCTNWLSYVEKISRWIFYTFVTLLFSSTFWNILGYNFWALLVWTIKYWRI